MLPTEKLCVQTAWGDCRSHDIPPAVWATGGLEVVSIKITPLPTLSPDLRSNPPGGVAGEHCCPASKHATPKRYAYRCFRRCGRCKHVFNMIMQPSQLALSLHVGSFPPHGYFKQLFSPTRFPGDFFFSPPLKRNLLLSRFQDIQSIRSG